MSTYFLTDSRSHWQGGTLTSSTLKSKLASRIDFGRYVSDVVSASHPQPHLWLPQFPILTISISIAFRTCRFFFPRSLLPSFPKSVSHSWWLPFASRPCPNARALSATSFRHLPRGFVTWVATCAVNDTPCQKILPRILHHWDAICFDKHSLPAVDALFGLQPIEFYIHQESIKVSNR